MSGLSGKIEITAVSAHGLEDVRFLSSMSPYIVLEWNKFRHQSPPSKSGGTKPQWNHRWPVLELTNANPGMTFLIEILDEKNLLGSVTMPLGDLVMRAVHANSAAQGSDKLVRFPVQSGKEAKKQKGELVLQVKWQPALQPAPKPQQLQQPQQQMMQPQPQMIQQPMGLQSGAPPQMQMQQQQLMQPPRPVQIVSQGPPLQQQQPGMYPGPPQPMQQPQYHPQPMQPGYAPQPMMAQPPMQPMQMQPQHMQPMQPMQPHMSPSPQIVYSPPAPMPGYGPPQPVAFTAPPPQAGYYPAGPSVVQPLQPGLSNQPFYPGQQPLVASAPVMPMVVQQPLPGPGGPGGAWQPASNNDDGVFDARELKFTRLIGDGTFGTVSAGEFRSTPVAIKQLKQSVFSPQQWAEFMSEVKFLREARHPNVVLFMGVSYNPYCIVTELLDLSLFEVLYKVKQQLTHKQKVHIALGIARGLASLHGHAVPIVHRDMKSLNILVSKDLVSVKICDLGMVKFKAAYGQRLEQNGTPLWMAPEVLLDQPYDEQADVYSFGCVLYELTTATVPFGGGNIPKETLVERVGKRGERPALPIGLEKCWSDLLIQCWQQHPRSRPTMKQVVASIAAIPV